MQAVKLTIPGEYWDSLIYSGRLYLFTQDGSIITLDWDKVIDEWPISPELRLALSCAFSRSDYFYGKHWNPLFNDSEVRSLIESKFNRLSQTTFEISKAQLHDCNISEQDNPFPFPHSDARVYGKRVYVSSQKGVYFAGCGKDLINGVSTRPRVRWDAPVFSLATYSNTLALAAGDEGVYEARIGDTSWQYPDEKTEDISEHETPRQVADQHCTSCEWAYWSIYGSSHLSDGFLASFSLEEADSTGFGEELDPTDFLVERTRGRRLVRSFSHVFSGKDLFRNNGYSWANRDKIYQAHNHSIRVIQYQPWREDNKQQFHHLDTIHLAPWKGDIVSAGVAVFGTIVECDNALVVLLSDNTPITIPGEPVRWRVFPRSKHYENQLHIAYDDHLELWSFNHDYFVDQVSKNIGTKVW